MASSGIEPESGASETLILSIVLRGHYKKEPRTKMPRTKEASNDNDQKRIQKSIIQAIEKESYEWLTIRVDNDGSITQE